MYLLGKIFIENTFKKENDTKESKTTKLPGLFNEINSENKQVIIVRGVPGSGRRTLINEYTDYIEEENYAVCDVNDFFTNKSGDYKYVHKDAVKAEDETLIKFLSALEKDTISYLFQEVFTKNGCTKNIKSLLKIVAMNLM